MTRTILSAQGLARHYRVGESVVKALDGVDLDIARGEFLGVVGSSGSGKSTLLNLLAGLDSPSSGRVEFDGRALDADGRRGLADYRARHVGLVFQSFQLLSHFNAIDNVALALTFHDTPRADRRRRAAELLERLGLGERLEQRPAELSGGEQQRVAIARALIGDPELVFADEPTGNLDAENSDLIAELLTDCHARGRTVVMVSHDLPLCRRHCGRVLHMDYGRIVASGDGRIVDGGGAP